ncbi:glycosyltransferase family 4 protein [Adhaeribacter aerolatus]|uniref:glycosyltransferase family 4 protein n=1 Tax=Adhaeribacter aerolatus TaxID=670289 RepID=UPI0011BEDA20|nr:glycosyltransferase [Adhaeribacter aerolatus]
MHFVQNYNTWAQSNSNMKVYYFSITSFSDVDMGIMHHLNADLVYGAIVQKRNANYTREELQAYCDKHNIIFEGYQMKYNLKDPRCLFTFLECIANIRKHKPEVIYLVAFDNIYFSLCSLLLNRTKTIIALHDVVFHSGTSFLFVLKLSRWITMTYFRNFQVFSREQFKIFKRLFPRKQVNFIPLPLKDFGNGNLNINKSKKVIQFLFFGNVLFYKGLDILLKAVNNLVEEKSAPPFTLVIAGRSDNWETEYEPLILYPEIVKKHIRFIGNDEVANFFQNADYLVLPYRDATQSGPLKIAFHYNIPVIASDISSFKEEVVSGVDGYLFKTGDVEDLKQTLLQSLNKHQTDYYNLKKAQLQYVNTNYSPEKVKHDFSEMFSKVS